MKCVLLDAGAPATLHPLTCTRPLSDCMVAGLTFRAAQLERITAAGLDTETAPTAGELCLHVSGSAWLPVSLLQAAGAAGPMALRSADGELLAWVGGNASAPDTDCEERTGDNAMNVKHPWDLLKVNSDLVGALSTDTIEGSVDPRVGIDGHIRVGAGTRILPGTYIEGNIVIGRDCKIGPNCYLRGNTSIGNGCHIGNAVEIKNSIIMSNTSVGHLSYCGDSVLGEGVNFGAGTITANLRHDGKEMRSLVCGRAVKTGLRKFGTIVGDNAHLGIHTSIYPGRKVWPDCSTLPGAVVSMDVFDRR